LPLCEIVATHGKQNNNTQTLQMKKTLLIAAAALAAGIISTEASSVYSQNIVGYANVVTPTSGLNYLITVPFVIGVSNGANEVFGSNLPDFSQVLIWNGSDYNTVQSDSGSPTGWDDTGFNPVSAPVLPVGMGFFLIPNGNNVTNTFTGSIAVQTGTTNTVTLSTIGQNYLVGSAVPYAGSVTNGLGTNLGLNMNGFADFTQLLIWNPSIGDYVTYQTDAGSPTGWDDTGFNPITPPSVSVGQGFFLVPNGVINWKQSL